MSIEEEILNSSKTVAIVGLSPKKDRPSYRVGSYLKEHGYRIIPVNPAAEELIGEKSYPDLSSIPEYIDVVDIFRRSEDVVPIVEEAIKIGARFVWMQEGVTNDEAAEHARKAGLSVVMNKCMRKMHMNIHGIMEPEEEILRSSKIIAVVGLSPKKDRPSHEVAEYLQQQGYTIIPVNPKATEILGEKSYPDLLSIPEKVDMVDIFRRSEDVIPIVEEAIKIGAKSIWMQEGVINEEAADRAKNARLLVVMDKCTLKEHQRMMQKQE